MPWKYVETPAAASTRARFVPLTRSGQRDRRRSHARGKYQGGPAGKTWYVMKPTRLSVKNAHPKRSIVGMSRMKREHREGDAHEDERAVGDGAEGIEKKRGPNALGTNRKSEIGPFGALRCAPEMRCPPRACHRCASRSTAIGPRFRSGRMRVVQDAHQARSDTRRRRCARGADPRKRSMRNPMPSPRCGPSASARALSTNKG